MLRRISTFGFYENIRHAWRKGLETTPFQTYTKKEITYFQQGAILYMVDGGTKTLAKNLRYLAFMHPRTDDPKLLSVTITLEKATYNAQTKALQLSVEKVRIHND